MSASVLVTGVTGLLGGAIAADLTARGQDVLAIVRGGPGRGDAVRGWVAALGGDGSRVVAIDGDLDRPGLGLPPATVASLSSVERVFHAAGRFAWDIAPTDARRTNRDGLLELTMLCRKMRSLQHFVLIGGYRATGPVWQDVDTSGVEPMEAMWRHHGPYVASKIEGLHAFRRAALAQRLPYTVLHPGDVIGHSQTGITNQRTGVGAIAELIHRGRLLAQVGSPRAWIPLVTADHVARLAVAVSESEMDAADRREYFVLDESTPSLHNLVRTIAEAYDRRSPKWTMSATLARWLPEFVTGTARESLAFVSEQRYPVADTHALQARLGVTTPPLQSAIARWLCYLASCDFRPEAFDWRGTSTQPSATTSMYRCSVAS